MVQLLRFLAVALSTSIVGNGALALTYSVINFNDSGTGSLRQAVLDANANIGPDTIVFAPGIVGKITLTSGILSITDSVTIGGPGAKLLTISGNNTSRLFNINDGDAEMDSPVTIADLTLADGSIGFCIPPQDLRSGGAINSNESLTLTNVKIRDSFASANGGGATFAPSMSGQAFVVQGSEFINNRAGCNAAASGGHGGGLNLSVDLNVPNTLRASVLIQNSRIADNLAVLNGGGLRILTPGTITIKNVVVSGNTASSAGGGIYVSDNQGLTMPSVLIDSSEISNNNAGNAAIGGGGLGARNDSVDAQTTMTRMDLVVRNSTVSGNKGRTGPGAGISVRGNVALTVQNSTVVNNASAQQETAGAAKAGGVFRQIGVQSGTATPNLEGTVTIQSSILSGNSGTIGLEDLGQLSTETFVNAINMSNSLIRNDGAIVPAPTGSGNLTGVDPLLLPLANYGGPTATHALRAESPAIDVGSDPATVSFDQRGLPRVVGVATDMGAYEYSTIIPQGCADLDGNGMVDALTDGLMAIRAMFGLTGTTVTSGAVGPGATRTTWAEIRAYMNANCGANWEP